VWYLCAHHRLVTSSAPEVRSSRQIGHVGVEEVDAVSATSGPGSPAPNSALSLLHPQCTTPVPYMTAASISLLHAQRMTVGPYMTAASIASSIKMMMTSRTGLHCGPSLSAIGPFPLVCVSWNPPTPASSHYTSHYTYNNLKHV
jgi:hypothetical protein